MTLAELVDLVCTKVHRLDPESQEEAKKYLRSRYQILWDSRLWRDSLDTLLLQGRQILNEVGEPLLDENGNILYAGLIDQTLIMPVIVGRIVCVRWVNTTLDVEEMSTTFKLNPQTFNQIGRPMSFSIISPSALPQQPGGRRLQFRSTSPTATYTVSIRGMLADADQAEVVTMAGEAPIMSAYSYDSISILAKTSATEDLRVQDDLGTQLMTLPRDETERRHQRITFHSTPNEAGSLFILYKKRRRDLNYGADSTEIEGMDNMLLAAAISDMYESARQNNKAALKGQEVTALMDVAMRLEREQSASNPRIIPWDGGGYDQIERATKGW
jgi:hypothetical protein